MTYYQPARKLESLYIGLTYIFLIGTEYSSYFEHIQIRSLQTHIFFILRDNLRTWRFHQLGTWYIFVENQVHSWVWDLVPHLGEGVGIVKVGETFNEDVEKMINC